MAPRPPFILALLLAIGASACRKSPSARGHDAVVPDLLSDSEEGFADLTLLLETSPRNVGGVRPLSFVGQRGGTRVSFGATLGPNWRRSDNPPITTFKGEVTFVRLGELSDAFLRELDRAYDTKLNPPGMVNTVSFTAISLEGNPSRLDAGPVKIKLFFEPPERDAYAELFLNIDLETKLVQVREKDPEYRRAIVRALSRR